MMNSRFKVSLTYSIVLSIEVGEFIIGESGGMIGPMYVQYVCVGRKCPMGREIADLIFGSLYGSVVWELR